MPRAVAAGARRDQRLSWRGWRIVPRLLALAAWLAICLIAYAGERLLLRSPRIPPLFLAGAGWICGVRTRSLGPRPQGSAILIANHVSWLDIPILARATGAAFVAHEGLAAIGPMRWLCEMNDTVFIARERRTTVADQVGKLRAALAGGRPLVLFAEGTTGEGTSIRPLKSSLLAAIDPAPDNTTVQPVLLDYGPEAAGIAWVGEEPGLANFLRILTRRRAIPVSVHFLAPLTGVALNGRKAVARAAQSALEGRLEVVRGSLQ